MPVLGAECGLHGYVCSHCRQVLTESGFPNLADEFVFIQSKSWIGKPTEPNSPAGIASNLGLDLFIAKGLKPTLWENIIKTVQQDGIKELVKIASAIVLALLLAYLVLQK